MKGGEALDEQETLKKKLEKEYEEFINNLEQKEPKEIINSSYEKVVKEDILMLFEAIEIPESFVIEMLGKDNLLDHMYSDWLNVDDSLASELEYSINQTIGRIVTNQVYEDARKGEEKMANEITFEIVEHIGVLAKYKSGWSKEINIVSWNNMDPKYDIREWSEDHTHMSKGVTLSENEAKVLFKQLERKFKERSYER